MGNLIIWHLCASVVLATTCVGSAADAVLLMKRGARFETIVWYISSLEDDEPLRNWLSERNYGTKVELIKGNPKSEACEVKLERDK